MRIDKYLWCVRLYKTRSIASEDVKSGKVLLNQMSVKPSRELKVGDVFTVQYHGFSKSYKVIGIPKSRVGAKLLEDLIVDCTPPEEIEKLEFLKLAKNLQRDKGQGRPTKKERRDLDKFGLSDDFN